jgi:Spy/CpxP family protein refolding chaperone
LTTKSSEISFYILNETEKSFRNLKENYMKKITLGILMVALIIACGIFALAHKSGRNFSERRDGFRERMFNRIASGLNLSEEQRTQAKQIREDSKSSAEPLMRQLEENRKQIRELGTDGVYNEQKVLEMASAQADLMKQLFIEKEKSKAQLFAILNDEQRERAKQKMSDFEGKFRKGGPGSHGAFKDEF